MHADEIVSSGQGLRPWEMQACQHYVHTNKKKEAYDKHSPEGKAKTAAVAAHFFSKDLVRAYVNYLRLSIDEQTRVFLGDEMGSGDSKRIHKAVAANLSSKIQDASRDGALRFVEVMKEVGAEYVVPVGPRWKGGEVTCSFGDLINGEAFLRMRPKARMRLLEMAGAPWNEQISSATLSELQEELLARDERILICHGGSGVGKSVLGGCLGILELAIPGRRVAIAADTFDHCHDEFKYIFEGFLKLFGAGAATKCSCVNDRLNKNMHIRTIWGSEAVTFSVGMNNGSDFLGKEFDRVIFGEASLVPPYVLHNRVFRCLDRRAKVRHEGDWEYRRNTGILSMFTTPNGYDGCASSEWDEIEKRCEKQFERLHVGNVDWAETAYVREASVLENPSYDRKIYYSRQKTLNWQAFDETYKGKRTFRTGMVYAEYNKDKHLLEELCVDTHIRQMRLGVGIDTGKHFSATLAGLDMENEAVLLGEVYTGSSSGGLPISDNCDLIKEMLMERLQEPLGLASYSDEEAWPLVRERIDLWYVDPASQHKDDISELLDVPLTFEKMHYAQFHATVDAVRDLFKQNRLFIEEESCPSHLWEMAKYIWNESKAKGDASKTESMPRKRDDHAMDSMRFILNPLIDMGPYTEAPAPTTFEDNWARQERYQLVGHFKQYFTDEKPSVPSQIQPRIIG